MKVLHVIGSVGPLRGGPSTVLRAIAGGLSARGVEVHVCTTDDNGPERLAVPLGQPQSEDGAIYRYFPRQSRFYIVSLPLALWLWRHIREYDLVHVHAVFSFASVAAAFVARQRGVPYLIRPLGVLNEWGLKNRRRKLKRLSLRFVEKPIFSSSALLHFTSEEERLEALRAGVDQRSVIIGNPVDLGAFDRVRAKGQFRAQYPEFDGKKIILFLSRVDRKKGLELLFTAFSRLPFRNDVCLVIAGDGDPSYVKELKALSESLHIAVAVCWAGFLSGKAKSAALADADVFVLPSYSENFGNAVVEALSAGVPVVISDKVGIHREVASAEAAIVVSCDAAAICEAITRVLLSPSVSERLARNGVSIANNLFSTDSVLTKLVVCYGQILGSGQGKRDSGLSNTLPGTTPVRLK